MSVIDRFLNVIKLNDDDYDDDDYLDDEADDLDDEPILKRRVKRNREERNLFGDQDDLDALSTQQEEHKTLRLPKPKKNASPHLFRRDEEDDLDDLMGGDELPPEITETLASTKAKRRRGDRKGMEVCVIRPHSMEDASEITETLLSNCTVILNVEGLELSMAQRIVDFASGSCYAMDGNLQPISNYIFILTPSIVDISGDLQEILSSAFDVPFEKRF